MDRILLDKENNYMKSSVKATFFVALNGNDEWSGKLAQPAEYFLVF